MSVNPDHQSPIHSHTSHPHLHRAKVKLVHSAHHIGKFKNILNPNHRHDEPHEKRIDEARLQLCQSHRFGSFAEETVGNEVKWYVDGRDYFCAVAEALESAREVVYIADWWLSPELFLKRPPGERGNEEWRLDKVLKRAAERGVKVYIIVYKEISQALTCNSSHTKTALEDLFPSDSPFAHNIVVMRHPDHHPFVHGADMTFYWAHHEKFLVLDHTLAFVGGLDLCFGRWDTHQHPLSDVHPPPFSSPSTSELWPGQDFNNNRILDFQNVENWAQNQLDKTKFGRMPWHDVALGIRGPAVWDVARHFVGRWNFVKRDKYKRHKRFPWLRLRGEEEEVLGVQHPRFPVGGYITHPLNESTARESLGNKGSCDVQLVRSSADWSHGLDPKENSIQTAYKELIEKAQHFIYIENQFFITATGESQPPIANTIGASLVTAIQRAHEENRPFRIIIIIPAIPGFPGDLREDAATGTRAIIDYQYKSICRGENSIYGRLNSLGIDASKYIFIFNLRIYDRLNVTKELRKQEEETGVKYGERQQNQAHEALKKPEGGHRSKNPFHGHHPHIPHILRPARDGAPSSPGVTSPGGGGGGGGATASKAAVMVGGKVDKIGEAIENPMERLHISHEHDSSSELTEVSANSESQAEASSASSAPHSGGEEDKREGKGRKASIAHYAFHPHAPEAPNSESKSKQPIMTPTVANQGYKPESYNPASSRTEPERQSRKEHTSKTSLDDLDGEGEADLENYIQEELYVHAKIMIIDDEYLICGSANINDRSQEGDHDSELAAVVRDRSESSKVKQLRMALWAEHLGLLEKQAVGHGSEDEDINCRPPGEKGQGSKNVIHAPEDSLSFLDNPMNPDIWNMWTSQASTNTEIYRELFRPDPDDAIRTWHDYDEFCPKRGKDNGKDNGKGSDEGDEGRAGLAGHLCLDRCGNGGPCPPEEAAKKEENGSGECSERGDGGRDGKKEERREEGLEEVSERKDEKGGGKGSYKLMDVEEKLSKIKGHLVWMPLKFLEDEEMAEPGLQVNRFTESIYT